MAKHEHVATYGNVPLSSIAPFQIKRARKHFLKGRLPDEMWTLPVVISRLLIGELLGHLDG